jgi:hypothetical protein
LGEEGRRAEAAKEGNVLDLNRVDLEVIATALADQADGEHQWLIDPGTGELVIWTSDTGIDGHNPIELEDLDPNLIAIDPIPSYIWYQDMVDFADRISDPVLGERLSRTLEGRGAFGRFKNTVYQHPELITPWQTWRDTRARRRAVGWLLDQELINPTAAEQYYDSHPDPQLP